MFTIPFDLFGFVDAIRNNPGILIITAIFGPVGAMFCLTPFARMPGISRVIQTLVISLLTSAFINLLCVIVIYLTFTKDIIRLFWILIIIQTACLSFWFINKEAVLKLAGQYGAIRQRHSEIEEKNNTKKKKRKRKK
ncbi:hypothetical protein [Photorhabdus khanii]|uniref:Uncharacterized protein n=1 Tax=Photorhabdus khanii subsp. guanajuatensis TaxID=2100166 RepID=A0A4R4J2A1_9GAMM|nr:hypothetical protein [Photorhabdus khanii]TDB47563.1 hypothetical protein C5467_20485 [Photorhabdus khanii subsp. guanajuatensis]